MRPVARKLIDAFPDDPYLFCDLFDASKTADPEMIKTAIQKVPTFLWRYSFRNGRHLQLAESLFLELMQKGSLYHEFLPETCSDFDLILRESCDNPFIVFYANPILKNDKEKFTLLIKNACLSASNRDNAPVKALFSIAKEVLPTKPSKIDLHELEKNLCFGMFGTEFRIAYKGESIDPHTFSSWYKNNCAFSFDQFLYYIQQDSCYFCNLDLKLVKRWIENAEMHQLLPLSMLLNPDDQQAVLNAVVDDPFMLQYASDRLKMGCFEGSFRALLQKWSVMYGTEQACLNARVPAQFTFVLLKEMADVLIGQQSPIPRDTLDLAKILFPKTSPDFVHNLRMSASLTIEEKRKCLIETGLSYQDALDFLVRYKNFQEGKLNRRALQDCLEYLLVLPAIGQQEFKYNNNYEDGADRDGIFWEHPLYDQFGCSTDTIKTYLENN